jgi:hypothetical protein
MWQYTVFMSSLLIAHKRAGLSVLTLAFGLWAISLEVSAVWIAIATSSTTLLFLAISMIAVLMSFAHGTAAWRNTARCAAALAGIVMALGTGWALPALYPADFFGQVLYTFLIAFLIGEGGLRFIVWLASRLLEDLEKDE